MSMIFAGFHNVAHLSKPILFTGASTLFLLVYGTLWTFHDSTEVRNASPHLEPDEDISFKEEIQICNVSFQNKNFQLPDTNLPVIYFVTPTYPRSVQLAELTRLGQTLIHIPALHWILVEDSKSCDTAIADLLLRLGIPHTHMVSPMPAVFKKKQHVPRGVSNRRGALQWIRNNVQNGVLYFGDDDNTYDLRLFKEIRHTQQISMVPVALIGDYSVSAPVVLEGKVVGFYDSWPAGRRFAVDMAGFAVNINLLHRYTNATMVYEAGFEEDSFLRSLHVELNDIEAKAENCTQILVWHTRTVQVPSVSLRPPDEEKGASSIQNLLQSLSDFKVATLSNKGKRSYVRYSAPSSS